MSLQTTQPVKTPARIRKRWWLLGGLLLLAGLVWAAPYIVAATALRDWAVARIFPQVDGTFASRSASLDWLSPVVFHDVTVTDRDGKTILRVARVQSQKTLLSLLLDPDQAGSFQIEQADLQLQVRGKEFNLEKVLPTYFGRAEKTAHGSSGRGGALSIAMEFLNSTISQHDADTDREVKLEMVRGKVNLAANSNEPVTVELQGTVVETAAGKADGPLAGKINAVFHWLAADQGSGDFTIHTDGMTLAAVNPLLRRAGIDAELSGRVNGRCVYRWGKKAGQEFSQIDADIASESIEIGAPWLNGDRIQLRQVTLPCRLALVGSRVHIDEANLTADLGKATLAGTLDLNDDLAGWLDEPGCTVSADVDLAALANQLPNALRLQSATRLDSGRVQLSCTSHKTGDGTVWDGYFNTTPLRGTRAGKALHWPEAITVVFRARKDAQGLPLVDKLHCDSRFLKIDGAGNNDDFRVRFEMDLEKLAEPMGQFVDLSEWQLRGQGWASLALHAGKDDVLGVESSAKFQNVQIAKFADALVEWQAAGRFAKRALHVTTGSLRTSAFAVQTNDLHLRRGAGTLPTVSGKAKIEGEISKVRQFLAPSNEQVTPITGALVAYLDLNELSPLNGIADVHLSDVVVGSSKAPTWREKKMRLWTQVRLDAADDLQLDRFYLETDAFACDARGKISELSGSRNLELVGMMKYDLAKLQPALRSYLGQDARLSGTDKQRFQLAGPLTPAADAQAHLTLLTGQTELGWQSLRLYGGDVGPADLKLRLQNGWLRCDPVHTTINGGKLHLQPVVRLEPGPAELALRPGLIVENAQITPAMSSGILGYAVPVLAGVTKIDGELSLTVDAARMPLAGPTQAEMHGKLQVHSARFGATKLVQELGAVFKAAPPSVLIKDCTVPVKMTNGKVYHEGLEFAAGDVSVRTSGWVAVNGQMNLLAEVAVPERWLSKISPNLKQQTVKLPIRGELGAPHIDDAAVRSALAQFTRDAAGKLLQREIEDRLKKLFQRQ